MSETQNNSIDFSEKMTIIWSMTVEGARVSETREVNVPPVDAVDVLSDNEWHMAQAKPGVIMHFNNYDPLHLGIFGSVDAPFHARSEIPEEEVVYPLEFVRDQGSWGREGDDLVCRGIARVEGKEIRVRLLVWDEAGGTGLFVRSTADTPQSNRR